MVKGISIAIVCFFVTWILIAVVCIVGLIAAPFMSLKAVIHVTREAIRDARADNEFKNRLDRMTPQGGSHGQKES